MGIYAPGRRAGSMLAFSVRPPRGRRPIQARGAGKVLNMGRRLFVGLLLLPFACSSGKSNGNGGAGAGGHGATTGSGGVGAGGGPGGAATTAVGTGGTTITTGAAGGVQRAASVLQHHNDLARDGLYVDRKLTLAAVMAVPGGLTEDASFAGATYAADANDRVFAQPLYLAGAGGGPDQVIVATERNQVYAFNAATGAQTWNTPVGAPVTAGLPCGNIATGGNSLGVTGTPVIDGVSRTIYLDAMTADAQSTAKHMVHALDADTGVERAGWPVDLNAKAMSGATAFNSIVQNQRAALTLVGGKLIVPFSGHVGDCEGYHGWVVAMDTTGVPTVNAWSTRAIGGGIWGSSGIASDGTSLFFATGNSKSSASAGANTSSGDNGGSWGDSETVYKFPTTLVPPGMVTLTDYFVPTNWVFLDDADADMGGTSPVLMTVPGATPSALVIAFGKDSNAYLLDRANLGGFGAAPLAELKVSPGGIINASVAYTTPTASYAVFRGVGTGCPAGETGGLTAIRITPASPPTLSIAWCGGPATIYSPAVSVSDSAGDDAIVWSVGGDNKLHGVNGDTGTDVFDAPTAMAAVQSIQTPIVANGRIFVASNNQVYAYKLP
jgi:outer membrane protein assembly factor BamB